MQVHIPPPPPPRFFAIEILYFPSTKTTALAAKWHCIPQIFKMQYIDK